MTHQSFQSPKIVQISWGRMEVEGLGHGRDFKLFPGGGREWDWAETNTHHLPGIQPAAVQELLENGSKIVVLTRGMQLLLQTCPETLQMLQDKNIQVLIDETMAAVEIYNRLVDKNELVGAGSARTLGNLGILAPWQFDLYTGLRGASWHSRRTNDVEGSARWLG